MWRTGASSKCSRAVNSILKSRNVSRKMKVQVYPTIIKPIILYAGETRTLTKDLERRLPVFQRSVLRRIFGPIPDEDTGEWRWRPNAKLMEAARIPPITSVLRS